MNFDIHLPSKLLKSKGNAAYDMSSLVTWNAGPFPYSTQCLDKADFYKSPANCLPQRRDSGVQPAA